MYFKRRFFIQLVIFGVSIPRGTPEASRQDTYSGQILHSKYIRKEEGKHILKYQLYTNASKNYR